MTVGFDRHHIHFASYAVVTGEEEVENAIQFIREIGEEIFVVGVVTTGEDWRGSLALKTVEEPDLSRLSDFDIIRIRLWKGT